MLRHLALTNAQNIDSAFAIMGVACDISIGIYCHGDVECLANKIAVRASVEEQLARI